MEYVLRTENLTKYFGKVHAVENLSLRIRKGEIYGFLGLNGAGKTTTIRMFLGMIRPTAGASYIFDQRVNSGNENVWAKIGYLVEIPYSYPELTVWENLEIVRRMRFLPEKKSVDTIINKLQLNRYADIKAKNLSLGNAQRLGIAKALIHNPEILLLDEPANGLDPAGIVEIRELLREMAFNQGATVFISSHILDEVSKTATRIGIIHEGRLIQEIDTVQLDKLRLKRLLINTENRNEAAAILEKKGYSINFTNEGTIETKNEDAIGHPGKIASILVFSGVQLTLLKVEEEDLESYFLRITGMRGGEK